VASLSQSSDKRQPASDVEDSNGQGIESTNDDVMDLFVSETEDLESPPPAQERREDASMTNSAKRDPEEVLDIRQINSGTSYNAIDLCDAKEVNGMVVTPTQNEDLANHLGESTLQRLQRLRTKREELRQERERYESGIPFNPEPQDFEAEDARPEPQ